MSVSSGPSTRRNGRDTDQRFHSAVAELEALMQATASEQHATGGSRMLAGLVDVPLSMPNASEPALRPALRSRELTGAAADHLSDMLAKQKLTTSVTRSAMQAAAASASSYRVATPPTQRSHNVPPLVGPRCHSASTAAQPSPRATAPPASAAAGSSLGRAQLGRGSDDHPLVAAPASAALTSPATSHRSHESPQAEEQSPEASWARPSGRAASSTTMASSPSLPCRSDGTASESSRPTSSSSTAVRPITSDVAAEHRNAAARHREALADALAVSEARREERRRARALQQQQQQQAQLVSSAAAAAVPSEGAETEHQAPTVASDPVQDSETASTITAPSASSAESVVPAEESASSAPSAATAISAEQAYLEEISAIKASAVAQREARLAELRAARLRDEFEEHLRKRVIAIVKDLTWEETSYRTAIADDESAARRAVSVGFASMTPQVDALHQEERQARLELNCEEASCFHAMQRLEVFCEWVEVTAGTRVDWELEHEAIHDDFVVETSWAMASEWHGEGRARIVAQAAAARDAILVAFAETTAEIVQREIWLLINQEADLRFALEGDERAEHFAVRDGCSSSRALVNKHAAAVRECRRQWEEYFANSKRELLELELAGRLLVQRDAVDGVDRMASDASFERTAMQVADLRRRKEAVDAAIKEAQSFAEQQQAKPPTAATAAPTATPSSSSNNKSAPKFSASSSKSKAAAPRR